MPILNLQRQMRELGRIRTGNQVASGNGRKRPAKLETLRFTSASKALIEAAQVAFGGTVVPWESPTGPEWEVITTTDTVEILVPPGQVVSQWMELWSGGGCLRRCDGFTNVLDMTVCGSAPTATDGGKVIAPCSQDVAERIEAAAKGLACKATTRLNVILPQLPDIGTWRLESHGYYAAVELAGTADVLAMATARGILIPARLRLDQREKREPGKPTKKFGVPVIEFVETRMQELQLTAGPQAPRLAAGGPPELPATTLPSTSDFRGPTIAVDEPDPDAVIAEAAAMAAPTGDVVLEGTAAALPGALTREALVAALEDLQVDQQMALDLSYELFPRPADQPLTNEQRGALVERLRRDAAAPVAAAL